MADDTATLRDTVVLDSKPESEPVQAAEPELKAPQIADAPSPEAAEIGQMLLASGVSKESLNSLLEAPKMLESLKYQWETNPKGFVEMLERTAPNTGAKFLEEVSQLYLDRNQHLIKTETGKPKGDSQPQNDLMQEVVKLREQTSRLLTENQQRQQAASLAAVRQRYDARVDDIFGKDEVKALGFTPSEVKNIKARLNQELSSDPAAVQRVNNGNFIDVPNVLQSLLTEKVSERKAAIEAEKKGREKVNAGAFWEFSNGPESSFLQGIDMSKAADSWEATEEAFGNALSRAR